MEVIEIVPRLRAYEPYPYWLLGASIRGFGVSEKITPEQRLAKVWIGMIERCYNSVAHDYPRYGGKGVSVCKRWHQVSNYITDVQLIHGWVSKLTNWDNFQLDKDYYGSNQYSPDTCVWLTRKENTRLNGQAITVTTPSGAELLYLSIEAAAEHVGMHSKNIARYLTNKTEVKSGRCTGYRFEYALDTSPNLRHPLT